MNHGPAARLWVPNIGTHTQHRDLVTENQDLYVLGGVAASHEGKPAQHADYE
jgi:hypothetical protein